MRRRRRGVTEGQVADDGDGVEASVVLCVWSGWSGRSSREEAREC